MTTENNHEKATLEKVLFDFDPVVGWILTPLWLFS